MVYRRHPRPNTLSAAHPHQRCRMCTIAPGKSCVRFRLQDCTRFSSTMARPLQWKGLMDTGASAQPRDGSTLRLSDIA